MGAIHQVTLWQVALAFMKSGNGIKTFKMLNNKIILSLQLICFLKTNPNTANHGTHGILNNLPFDESDQKKLKTSGKKFTRVILTCSQQFETSTVKIITQAEHLHVTGWRTFWPPHGAGHQGEPQAQTAKAATFLDGMKNYHWLHIPSSQPG